ncbi:hypothetical protein DIPPA_59166 [Diplonema papillatum]|nr:hypothetical protein DIPPA_59166 [Diplonema papillatum]
MSHQRYAETCSTAGTDDTKGGMLSATVDEVLATMGFGRYQALIFTFGIVASIMCGLHTTTNVFNGREYELRCISDTCIGKDPPSMSSFCSDPTRFADVWEQYSHGHSIVMEWGRCGNTWMGPLVGSMFFAGWFAGGMSARIADVKGRYLVVGAWIVLSSCSLLSSRWSPYLPVFYGFKFLHGAFTGSLSLVCFVFPVEACTPEWQGMVGSVIVAAFAIGAALCVPLAYNFSRWEDLNAVAALIALLPVVFLPFLCESPRWLVSIGALDRAERSLQHIAAINGMSMPDVVLVAPETSSGANSKKPQLSDALASPTIRKRGLAMGFFWFVASVTYYGLNFAAGSLGGDFYVNTLLLSIVELPAYAWQVWAVDFPLFARRGATLIGFSAGAFGCLAFFVLKMAGMADIGRGFAFLGKMGVSASFAACYIWGAELFPTDLRSTAMGWCTACARVGGLVAPFAASFESAALLLFGGLSLSAALISRWLPETLGTTLPQSLAELEATLDSTHIPHQRRRVSKRQSARAGKHIDEYCETDKLLHTMDDTPKAYC